MSNSWIVSTVACTSSLALQFDRYVQMRGRLHDLVVFMANRVRTSTHAVACFKMLSNESRSSVRLRLNCYFLAFHIRMNGSSSGDDLSSENSFWLYTYIPFYFSLVFHTAYITSFTLTSKSEIRLRNDVIFAAKLVPSVLSPQNENSRWRMKTKRIC